MNQVIKNLEVIKQDLNNLQAEFEAKLEAVRQEYHEPLETMHKRYESYRLVAEELGLLKTQQSDETPAPEKDIDTPIKQAEEKIPVDRHPAQKYDIPIADAAEKVLRETGVSMKIEALRHKVAELGITPTPATFRSALAKDRRFEKVKRGLYKLRGVEVKTVENQPNSLFASSEMSVVTNGNGDNQTKDAVVLTESIKEIVSKLNGEQFDADWLFDTLKEKHPSVITEDRRQSVIATLGNLAGKGVLEKIQRGKDGKPAIFKPIVQENQVSETVEEAIAKFEKDGDDTEW